MHSQYDEENDAARTLIKMPVYGLAGMGALYGAGKIGRGIEKRTWATRYASEIAAGKNPFYAQGPLSRTTSPGGIVNEATQFRPSWDPLKKTVSAGKGIMEDFHQFRPFRSRWANSFDVGFQKIWGRNVSLGRTRISTPSMAGAFALMGIEAEVNQRGAAGLITGGIKEGAAFLGYRIGSQLGAGLAGGLGATGVIGGFVGGAALAMGGYMAIETVMKISKMGRKWTLPEFGGNFHDSFGAQTMRQRSLNSIATSQFNMRNELGNEATRIMGI